MYRLVPSAIYEEELARLSEGTDGLFLLLDRGLYHVLRNKPDSGYLIPGTDLRSMRQMVIRGVLLVEVFYRIDEEESAVRLASIRSIDMTVL